MRLLDEVAQSAGPLVIDLPGGRSFDLPGAGASATALAECPLRYVLDDEVYVQCMHVVTQWPDLLDPGDALLRLPVDRLWLEWTEPAAAIFPGEKPQRCGVFVTSEPGGRRGRVESFWRHPEYGVERAQVCIEFDLDHPIEHRQDGRAFFPVPQEECLVPALHGHAVLRVYDEWLAYFRATRDGIRKLGAIVDGCARQVRSDLPIILAFCRLLRARATDEKCVERAALNRVRARRGHAVLLDHVEVGMRIGGGAGGGEPSGQRTRAAARLHLVRGHLVHRNGALFWRSAHMRGALTRQPVRSRTVRVAMGGELHI